MHHEALGVLREMFVYSSYNSSGLDTDGTKEIAIWKVSPDIEPIARKPNLFVARKFRSAESFDCELLVSRAPRLDTSMKACPPFFQFHVLAE